MAASFGSRIEVFAASRVEVKIGAEIQTIETRDTGIGVHVTDVDRSSFLARGDTLAFRVHPHARQVVLPKRYVLTVV